jgi:hypothetical protein
MDEKWLTKLLSERTEKAWLEFKAQLKLYRSDGTLVEIQKDEFIKDILGLANGNSHIIRKTKYLIIGADNAEFDKDGCRILHDVDYKTPSTSDITKWLVSASGSAVVGLESEIVCFRGKNLFLITIPPTFKIHETIRKLDGSKSYQRHTVFMREDEHTVPASVQDIQDIKHLKQLHRQEIKNPSSNRIGAIAGAVVGFIIGGARIKAEQINMPVSETVMRTMFVLLGIFFGEAVGWFGKQWNETRYDWRYMTLRQRIILISFVLIMPICEPPTDRLHSAASASLTSY